MTRTAVTPGAERIPTRTKLFFGLGATAEFVALVSVSSFSMLFYNQVMGLPATLAGMAISASLILDGLADPIVGSLSDRTRSRFGRRHLYMYLAPLPVALSLFALFNPPDQLPVMWLFAWFLVFVVSLRVSMAVYHVPHLALGGEMSPDYMERSRVMSWNSLFGIVGATGASILALTFFFHATDEYPRGLLNPEAYAPFSVAAALTVLVLLLASAWFTRDRIPLLPPPPADLPKFSPLAFVGDMKGAFTNPNYVWLLVGYFFLAVMLGTRQGLDLYMRTYFWGFTSEQIRWFALGVLVGYFGGFLATAAIHKRFDKKRSIIFTCVGLAVIPAVAPSLRLLGWMPPNGDPLLLPIIVGMAVLAGIVTSILGISVMSALADVADENELRYGFRQEGVLYSTRALFAKIDGAIGHLVAGIALDQMIEFPQKATPGRVDDDVLFRLGLFDGPMLVIPGLIAAVFYARYRITRSTYETTKAKLAEVRAARLAAANTVDPAALA